MFSRFSRVSLFETPWTIGYQAPLFMGFSRQEYWRGLPSPPPGDLLDSEIEPMSLTSPAKKPAGFFTTSATWEALLSGVLVSRRAPSACVSPSPLSFLFLVSLWSYRASALPTRFGQVQPLQADFFGLLTNLHQFWATSLLAYTTECSPRNRISHFPF